VYSKKYDEHYFQELNNRFPGDYHILHVGRKTEQKNPDTVIKALNYIDRSIVAVFVGRGDTEFYQKLADEQGVYDRCYFVDRVQSSELPYWYSWCDCMCTPSRWEGFGYVFVEAAASEAAIVTSNIRPMNEYLTDKKSALLIDAFEDPIVIAKAIRKCIDNGKEIQEMKRNAREVALSFSKDAVDRQEIEIYKEVIYAAANNRNNSRLKRKQMLQEKKEKTVYNIKRALKIIRINKLYHLIKRDG
jgi:glycosyltransferase involved in cell wall biosynthesis